MKYGAERFVGSLSKAVNKGERKKIRAQERRAGKKATTEWR